MTICTWDDDPELVPYWHFVAEDGHEDYALSEDDLVKVSLLYLEAGIPFTVNRNYRD